MNKLHFLFLIISFSLIETQVPPTTTTETMSSSCAVDTKITLMSSEGEIFKVERWVVMEWRRINRRLEVNCANTVIPLPEVTSKILSKVIEYSKKHEEARREKKDDKSSDEELENWDHDFVKVNDNAICDIFLAANYLKIQSLMDLTYKIFAGNITERGWHWRDRAPEWRSSFIGMGILIGVEIMLYIVRNRQRMRDWGETAKKWLIVLGLLMYIGMFIIRMVWVIYLI